MRVGSGKYKMSVDKVNKVNCVLQEAKPEAKPRQEKVNVEAKKPKEQKQKPFSETYKTAFSQPYKTPWNIGNLQNGVFDTLQKNSIWVPYKKQVFTTLQKNSIFENLQNEVSSTLQKNGIFDTLQRFRFL